MYWRGQWFALSKAYQQQYLEAHFLLLWTCNRILSAFLWCLMLNNIQVSRNSKSCGHKSSWSWSTRVCCHEREWMAVGCWNKGVVIFMCQHLLGYRYALSFFSYLTQSPKCFTSFWRLASSGRTTSGGPFLQFCLLGRVHVSWNLNPWSTQVASDIIFWCFCVLFEQVTETCDLQFQILTWKNLAHV